VAAYRRVYDSSHLQADCQESGSAPECGCGGANLRHACDWLLQGCEVAVIRETDEVITGLIFHCCPLLTHTFTCVVTALFQDYPGELVPERRNQSGFY